MGKENDETQERKKKAHLKFSREEGDVRARKGKRGEKEGEGGTSKESKRREELEKKPQGRELKQRKVGILRVRKRV